MSAHGAGSKLEPSRLAKKAGWDLHASVQVSVAGSREYQATMSDSGFGSAAGGPFSGNSRLGMRRIANQSSPRDCCLDASKHLP